MRTNILGLLLLTLLITLGGCKDLFTKHDVNFGGVGHGKKINYSMGSEIRGAKNCTSCHGIALGGNAFIPGCYDCHDALWSREDHTQPRSSVATGRTTPVKHRRGSFVAGVKCVTCHGATLTGGSDATTQRPGCTDCHGDNWTRLNTHTLVYGDQSHGADIANVENSASCEAGDCHGATLAGVTDQIIAGVVPAAATTTDACNTCHIALWVATGHNIDKGGSKHKAGLYSAENAAPSDCATCHTALVTGDPAYRPTPNSTGNTYNARSCITGCHLAGDGKYWIKTPHVDSEDGAMHGIDKDNPGVDCVGCHIINFNGYDITRPNSAGWAGTPGVPGCFTCHGVEWD